MEKDDAVNDAIKKEKKNLLNLYGLFGASLALTFMPHYTAAILTVFLFIALLAISYTMRATAKEGSLVKNHTTYIIRTIWVGSLISLVTLSVASFYLVNAVDHTPLLACTDRLVALLNDGTEPDFKTVGDQIEPCLIPYFNLNGKPLIIAAIVTIVPVLIYFIWRFITGLYKSTKGEIFANPKAWF